MAKNFSEYLIIGGGLASASAAKGIRDLDPEGVITMIGAEDHLPYDRPPLSKKLWFGTKQVKDIFIHNDSFYHNGIIEFLQHTRVTGLDLESKTIRDDRGETREFGKLLLATGGTPNILQIPGGDLDGICYYRTLDDYQRIRELVSGGSSAVIIGGGFIGSEMAAALCINEVNVTMLYPSPYLCNRVFPEALGLAMENLFENTGIRILNNQKPVLFERKGSKFMTWTSGDEAIQSDIVIVGAGIHPVIDLARQSGLSIGNGIIVNEYLETSQKGVYAAGDIACFPCAVLGQSMRMEHWDNALSQGRQAGRNMAGAHETFTYLPYFFSDLFDFGYEAVGQVDSGLTVVEDWQKEYEKGVIYYLDEGIVRGAMMCNVWDKVPAARELIESAKKFAPEELRGVIA
jgi:3-phenylpropionate/trans-cinnamate dioxygenase ferredoxin reductase component